MKTLSGVSALAAAAFLGNTQFENQGITVFITDENKFFQTSGCPDWVQFE